jgi:hypothetical protein
MWGSPAPKIWESLPVLPKQTCRRPAGHHFEDPGRDALTSGYGERRDEARGRAEGCIIINADGGRADGNCGRARGMISNLHGGQGNIAYLASGAARVQYLASRRPPARQPHERERFPFYCPAHAALFTIRAPALCRVLNKVRASEVDGDFSEPATR